jgi:hypothetical protein
MNRTNIYCLILVSLLAGTSQAAFLISTSCVPTPGLPGFHTITVTGTSTFGDLPISSIDFVGDGTNDPATGWGFFGPMNQLGPPLLNTVFQDNNYLLPVHYPGHSAAEDSQFLVSSSAVVVPLDSPRRAPISSKALGPGGSGRVSRCSLLSW